MKIAVYTIAKNEEQFASRWAKSCADADVRLVLDTGSTDQTVERLRDEHVTVIRACVMPWRFDTARNIALAHVALDVDICIALDMDEVLVPGWREALEKTLAEVPGCNRPTYEYVWSWNPDGSPGLTYHGEKIHRRASHRWKHPVHETLVPVAGEVRVLVPDLRIEHHPDSTKSRGHYLDLLLQAVEEDPTGDRNLHYCGRELVWAGRPAEGLKMLQRHLDCPNAIWGAERAASLCFMADAHLALKQDHMGLPLLLRAVIEDPLMREPWVALLNWAYRNSDWALGYWAAGRALAITQRPVSYINWAWAWGALPFDLGAICAYNLGLKDRALEWGHAALVLEPMNERLQENMTWYSGQRVDKTPPVV